MVIIGAKGLAKELLMTMLWDKLNVDNLYFFDNINKFPSNTIFERFPVLTTWKELELLFKNKSSDFALGVGSPKARMMLSETASRLGGKLLSIISEKTLIGPLEVSIGRGTCILPNAMITCSVSIGMGSLVNKFALISHDATVGSFCVISPGARILGRAVVGDCTEIGSNAIILPDIVIGPNCRIGAGAVVTKNAPANSTLVGVPARIIKTANNNQNNKENPDIDS